MLNKENTFLADQIIARLRSRGTAVADWRQEAGHMGIALPVFNIVLEELAGGGWIQRTGAHEILFTGKGGTYREWCRDQQLYVVQHSYKREQKAHSIVPECTACVLMFLAATSLFLIVFNWIL